jgi:hypothetical protein
VAPATISTTTPANRIKYLQAETCWPDECLFKGMNFWLIFFAAQVVVTVVAVVREKKNNSRFEGDKLGYRS